MDQQLRASNGALCRLAASSRVGVGAGQRCFWPLNAGTACGILGHVVRSFQTESLVRLSPALAWEHATTPSGINAEFHPFLRMTFPASIKRLSEDWYPGKKLFRSWILLFGVIPVEYDDLALIEVEEGRRFLERSQMLSQKLWQHEREILEESDGVRIVDRVIFESRVPALEPVQSILFRAVFRYRHLRLRYLYGHDSA